QVGGAQITGVIVDDGGAAVPGATISVIATETGTARTVVSSATGVYTVASLPPGPYRIDIPVTGFRPLRREGVRPQTGVTTRSGGNTVRGTAFEFLRNETLNARNYFAPSPAPKPEFRRNQFGGVVGGPVVRDHTFFFADYQGQQQSIARAVISTVPTLLQR